MRLLIDEKELALLLEKKRDLIGNKVTIDTIIAGISFLLSVFTASYDDLLGDSWSRNRFKDDLLYDWNCLLPENCERCFRNGKK